jgi:hypothetical protein
MNSARAKIRRLLANLEMQAAVARDRGRPSRMNTEFLEVNLSTHDAEMAPRCGFLDIALASPELTA